MTNRTKNGGDVAVNKHMILGLWVSLLMAYGYCAQADTPVGRAWEEVQVVGSVNPFPRDTFAACTVEDEEEGYIFGGGEDLVNFPIGDEQGNFAFFDNDLYHWEVVSNGNLRFEKMPVISLESPSARGFPEIVCTEDAVYLYGGVNDQFNSVDDPFWKYDTETRQWTQLDPIPVQTPNAQPTAGFGELNGVAMQVVDEDEIILFGGIYSFLDFSTFTIVLDTIDQTWRYDIGSDTWTDISSTSADAPEPKHIARSGLVEYDDDEYVLVYGGEQVIFSSMGPGFPIDTETHLINVESGETIRRASGPAQNYTTFACNEEFCLLSGGDVAGTTCPDGSPQKVTNDTYLYHVKENNWQLLELGNMPAPAKRARSVSAGNYVYKFGGFDIVCSTEGDTQPLQEDKIYRIRFDEDD